MKENYAEDIAAFRFPIGEDEIAVVFDPTGQESFYLNGDLLESNRSFRLSGTYSVQVHGVTYDVSIKVKNPITGVADATLSEEGRVISRKRLKTKLGNRRKVLSFLLLALGSAALGVALGSGYIPLWLTALLSLLVVVGATAIRGRKYVVEEVRT